MPGLNLPTNEGTLALARSVATGSKLAIRGAVLLKTDGALGSPSDVAVATWGSSSDGIDLSDPAYVVEDGGPVKCTSYLPSMVDLTGEDTGSPVAALDLEFTWMPPGEVEYDTLAVLADIYYEFMPFMYGKNYTTGATVWYLLSNGSYVYYRCISPVDNSDYPMNDSTHWMEVHPSGQAGFYPPNSNVQYMTIDDRPVVLYVSVLTSAVRVNEGLEIDYKVRLYLDGVADSTQVNKYVVFDTLGPEFMGSAQIALLANFAQQLRNIRDVAMAQVAQGG